MLETLPDEDLMLRLKSGELEAFNVLMKRHKDSVLNFCYRLTGHREEAEDITQEVFIRLFKSAESYYPKARFTVFLYTIARNLCLNYLDRERRRPDMLSLDEGVEAVEKVHSKQPLPSEELERKMIMQTIEKAINGLPENLRIVFVLSLYGGLKYREIAELLDCPLGTVKSRMAEACRRLRRKLEGIR